MLPHIRPLRLLILLLLVLAGCRQAENGPESAALATPEQLTGPVETVSAAPSPTPAREAVPTPAPAGVNRLILWTSADFAPRSELPGGQLLGDQLAVFGQNNPDLALEVQLKALTGQGGTLSYLRTGRTVAPTILPDLVLLSTDQLPTATNDRLIYPIEQYLSAAMLDDLYPAAESLVQFDNHIMGYPFAMTGLHHLAYSRSVITETLPVTWTGLVQLEEASFIFPASGLEGAELVLHLYLAAGGSLVNEAGQPDLQVEPLTIALSQIGRGRGSGLISLQSSSVTSLAEAWQLFQNGVSSLVQTRSTIFLAQDGLANNWGYAPLPGIEQAAVPQVKSWVWAVSTPDPARQAKAVELIAWLTAPENLGPWGASSYILPARRSALESWTAPADYLAFVDGELERAQPYPAAAASVIMNAFSEAVFDVVTLAATPQLAAQRAAEAVRP